MLLLERAWGNEPGLLTFLALCAALVCQQAWMIDRRQGVPFLRSRWAHLCLVTLAGGSVALGVQLFGLGASGPTGAPEAVAAVAPIVPAMPVAVRPAAIPAPAAMRAASGPADLADSVATSTASPH